ncbi:YIP1 family protein [Methanoculleus sp. Wushi-C6]|uniref:YIP1 family protein n=1 Tax=Methanoculleus caldifontis TaxID=2651577 RepID=A0ABU3WYY6_9EURY|nr:Yip1 family protein [Methanoculleus sp. Wushi-C6]MDV2481024.1 YIP1 family protein [Methanoculleus sp. Wushi-C6]
MEAGFLRVLLNPGRFFEARMQEEPSLKVPALIALVIGVIGAVSAALVANMFIGFLPAEAQIFGLIGVILAAVFGVIGGFVMWIAFGIVFYLISMAFKGKGSFKRTLEVTGYGFLPQVFGGIIGAFFSYQLISKITIPVATSPEQIAEFSESIASALVADPLAQIAGLVGILFMIWSANIWVFGMKYARSLSTRDAALTVGIPVGLYILYSLTTLAGWL